jgi:hypothetical protein
MIFKAVKGLPTRGGENLKPHKKKTLPFGRVFERVL